jgi:hypothetical protein
LLAASLASNQKIQRGFRRQQILQTGKLAHAASTADAAVISAVIRRHDQFAHNVTATAA